MLEENRQELGELMNLYQSDEEGLRAKKEAEKLAQTKFSTDFEKLKHDIIWPAIVDVGNELIRFGHDFHVTEEREYVDAVASFHPAHMTLNIYPSSLEGEFRKPESAPYISFIANSYAKKVGIMVSTMMPGEGGSIGSHGEYEPEKITRDFVEKELINVLKNTLIFHTEQG
ncbi:MAG: hypothetical protein M1324_01855 [Patescibacteria group bacterium]|nr:hypothetical protein [Patescibacteria group bacterium]